MQCIVRNVGFNCLLMYVTGPKCGIFRHWLSEVNTLEMKNPRGGALRFGIGREACPIFLGPKILSRLTLFDPFFLPVQVYNSGFSLG